MPHTAASIFCCFTTRNGRKLGYIEVHSAYNLLAFCGSFSLLTLLLLLLLSLLMSGPFSREHPWSCVRHRLCRTRDGYRHGSTVFYRGFCLVQLFALSLS